jgi:RNA polymerase sigma factor (sigma-70 family)
MVLGVCRRVLHDEHAAEDAFQATLLVLARKARTICERQSLGSWLWKVAYRVALRARSGALRRARRERQVDPLPAVADPRPVIGPAEDDLHRVLDEELQGLPEKQRVPVVLCYLEGLTNEEAARQLRCPVGTLKTRLAQARRVLGHRLARRGLTTAVGLLAAESLPPSALPATLLEATVRAAASAAAGEFSAALVPAEVAGLMQGVLRAMMVTKMKWTALVLAVGLAIAGAGTASYRSRAGEPPPEDREEGALPPPSAAQARVKDLKKQIRELTEALSRAEEDAARERALPPAKTPVAIIFGNEPITRDELAEYLLRRLTTKQLEDYVNRRILEHVAKKEGIVVTEAEVDAFLKGEVPPGGQEQFRARLREQGKSMREWREDVVRARLLLEKLGKKQRITEESLRRLYESQYGEKVECRMLSWQQGGREVAEDVALRLRRGKTTFDQLTQNPPLGSRIVQSITIPRQGLRHPNTLIEAVSTLKLGEVSPVIAYPEGFFILECRRRIPADQSVRFEDVRENLKHELQRRFQQRDSTKFFEELKAEARTRMLWTPPDDPEHPER